MGTTPKTRVGKIGFYEAHLPAWETHAGVIGLSPQSVADLAVRTSEARAAYEEQRMAEAALRAATAKFHDKVAAMHGDAGGGADMIRTIRAFADSSGDPEVYSLAQIPPPAAHGVVGAPGTPFDFRVALRQSGAIELKWKCRHPRGAEGTVYELRRCVDDGAFAFVGSVGAAKKFTDQTTPPGSASVTYQVTAVRSTGRGGVTSGRSSGPRCGQNIPNCSLYTTCSMVGCSTSMR